MLSFTKKKSFLLLAIFFVLLAVIPLTVSVLDKPQETRSRAAASTTLSLQPTSSTSSPIQKNAGDEVDLDVMVNPGTNLVTFLRLQVKFDPTKLELSSTPFAVNTTAFPVAVEGPVVTSGVLAQSVSIGSDPTKAIQTATKVGTLKFKAIGNTGNTPTVVSFGDLSQALSSGSNDSASTNVLSTTTPAYIVIGGTSITPSASVSPTPRGPMTNLNFTILLHGIGASGDSPNPQGADLSNKNPLHPQRNLDVHVFDSNNQLVSSVSSPLAIIYQEGEGNFKGSVDLGTTFATGNYNIKIKTDRYLRKLIPGIQRIKNLEDNEVPMVEMVAGDTNSDNSLNILDYNALLDCGYGAIKPLPMEDPNSMYKKAVCQAHKPPMLVDLNDNGIIDSTDFNLFLRELSVQYGD